MFNRFFFKQFLLDVCHSSYATASCIVELTLNYSTLTGLILSNCFDNCLSFFSAIYLISISLCVRVCKCASENHFFSSFFGLTFQWINAWSNNVDLFHDFYFPLRSINPDDCNNDIAYIAVRRVTVLCWTTDSVFGGTLVEIIADGWLWTFPQSRFWEIQNGIRPSFSWTFPACLTGRRSLPLRA